MTDNKEIRKRLYEKYIAPTKRERDACIGIEIELPILNLEKTPVDFDFMQDVTRQFLKRFGFAVEGRDDDGRIYAAIHEETGDILSYDCSYNNLELSMGKEKEIGALDRRFRAYFRFLQDALAERHHTLTGMGINPYRSYNRLQPIANERYRMLLHHLESYEAYGNLPMHFHHYPRFGMFASASQVQLDIRNEDLIPTIRAFSLLEPVKSLIFSNSVMNGEHEELFCCRDMLWENSTHGINPHNVGMFESIPESEEELLDYLESESLYCVMRDGKYINFPPIPLLQYFQQEAVEGEQYDGNGSYQKVSFTPEIGDLSYLRTFKFEDLTFRGTIEFRSCCSQPVKDAMTIPAFHVGLQQNLKELDSLLTEDRVLYHHGFDAAELRKAFNRGYVPETLDQDALWDLVKQILNLAADGLRKRGCGEERFLEPLYERIAKRTNPAKEMLSRIQSGEKTEDLIRDYGTL